MASVLGENFDYTYNGNLLTEVFFKPSVGTPQLDSIFRILPGSKYKIQAPLGPVLSKIVKAGTDCTRTAAGSVNLTNQTIELSPLKMFVEECAEEFETATGNILAEEWLKSGVDVNDISGTQLEATINTMLEDALRRDVFRIVSFGDTSDADNDFNQLEGLWAQLIANSGGGTSYCVNKVASFGTATLSAGEALAAFKAAYEGADAILDQIPEAQKRFYVTRSVFDNLVSSYESVSTGSDLQVGYLADGIPIVRYRGVEVVKISAWDESLADTANPLNGTTSHLLLYTTRENHVLGVENSADLNRIRSWYSLDDDKYKFDSKMRIGYNYLHCDLQTIAY
jgi:hypothetical protein